MMQDQRQLVSYGTRCRLTSKAEFHNRSGVTVHLHTADRHLQFTSLRINANGTLRAHPSASVDGAAEAGLEQYTQYTSLAGNTVSSVDIGYFGVRRMTILAPRQDGDPQNVRRAYAVDNPIKAGHTYIFTRPGDTDTIKFQTAVPVQNMVQNQA